MILTKKVFGTFIQDGKLATASSVFVSLSKKVSARRSKLDILKSKLVMSETIGFILHVLFISSIFSTGMF